MTLTPRIACVQSPVHRSSSLYRVSIPKGASGAGARAAPAEDTSISMDWGVGGDSSGGNGKGGGGHKDSIERSFYSTSSSAVVKKSQANRSADKLPSYSSGTSVIVGFAFPRVYLITRRRRRSRWTGVVAATATMVLAKVVVMVVTKAAGKKLRANRPMDKFLSYSPGTIATTTPLVSSIEESKPDTLSIPRKGASAALVLVRLSRNLSRKGLRIRCRATPVVRALALRKPSLVLITRNVFRVLGWQRLQASGALSREGFGGTSSSVEVKEPRTKRSAGELRSDRLPLYIWIHVFSLLRYPSKYPSVSTPPTATELSVL